MFSLKHRHSGYKHPVLQPIACLHMFVFLLKHVAVLALNQTGSAFDVDHH